LRESPNRYDLVGRLLPANLATSRIGQPMFFDFMVNAAYLRLSPTFPHEILRGHRAGRFWPYYKPLSANAGLSTPARSAQQPGARSPPLPGAVRPGTPYPRSAHDDLLDALDNAIQCAQGGLPWGADWF
jgi:hypothetical protein